MKVMHLEIRDTDPHDSKVLDVEDILQLNVLLQRITVYWDNNLDKSVTLQVKGSPNNTKFFNVGDAKTIAITEENYDVINETHFFMKITVQASEAPTSGAIKLWIEVS